MADSTFYSTIAQVLPVFVLALVAERRFGVHERSSDPGLSAIIGIAVLVSVAIGELAAFDALSNHPSHNDRTAAEMGTAWAGVFLLADLVWGQVRAHREHSPSKAWRWAVQGFALFVMAGAVALLALFMLSIYA